MKFNIFDLKVIKVKHGDGFHYFICKPKFLFNTYAEILTGKKITVKDETYIESLSNYYSILERCNYTTGRPLMLSKQNLLDMYIIINDYTSSKQTKENNEFGDKNYQMPDTYKTDSLVVANFQRVSSKDTDSGPMLETTEQKYIFEVIRTENETKYREIFTGFIANDELEYFDLPYVVNPIPFINYFPETKGIEVPKLSLIWAQNDINYQKNKLDTKKLKRN